jgi:hypothetical protein
MAALELVLRGSRYAPKDSSFQMKCEVRLNLETTACFVLAAIQVGLIASQYSLIAWRA